MLSLNVCRGIQLCCILGYIFTCPYTKVEESFNLQALHDLFQSGKWLQDEYNSVNSSFPVSNVLNQFDHLEFPGVVPRSFLGAIAIYILSLPALIAIEVLQVPKYFGLLAVRAVLGLEFWRSLGKLTRAIVERHGEDVGWWFTMAVNSQFHLLYYASRTLPNTFSTILVMVAVSYLVSPTVDTDNLAIRKALSILVIVTVVLRCDTVVLLGTISLGLLFGGKLSIPRMIGIGLMAGSLGLALTVCVDSFFWKAWLWPEGTVLYFNTVLNKSKEWGVMPFGWYFTSALPRALLTCFPLSAVGMLRLSLDSGKKNTLWTVIVPTMAFVFLLSFLPHKELRFIFPSLPVLNYSAALAMDWCSSGRGWLGILRLGCYALLLVNITLSVFVFLNASMLNYPGAEALMTLQQQVRNVNQVEDLTCNVHISAGAAISGISRFLQEEHVNGVAWKYSKDEALESESDFREFDFAITEHPDIFAESQYFKQSKVVFGSPRLSRSRLNFVTTPEIYVFTRKDSPCA